MARVDTDRIVSISDVGAKGISALVDDALEHRYTIISRRNIPTAAMVSIEYLSALQDAEVSLQRDYEDTRDWMLAVARAVSDEGHRTPLDDVLDRLGYTREQLASIPD